MHGMCLSEMSHLAGYRRAHSCCCGLHTCERNRRWRAYCLRALFGRRPRMGESSRGCRMFHALPLIHFPSYPMQVLLFYPDGKRSSAAENHIPNDREAAAPPHGQQFPPPPGAALGRAGAEDGAIGDAPRHMQALAQPAPPPPQQQRRDTTVRPPLRPLVLPSHPLFIALRTSTLPSLWL